MSLPWEDFQQSSTAVEDDGPWNDFKGEEAGPWQDFAQDKPAELKPVMGDVRLSETSADPTEFSVKEPEDSFLKPNPAEPFDFRSPEQHAKALAVAARPDPAVKADEFKNHYAEINQYFDAALSAIPSDNLPKRAEIANAKQMAIQDLNESASAQGVPFRSLVETDTPFVEPVQPAEYEKLTGVGGTAGKVASGLQQVGSGFLEMFKDPMVLGSIGLAKAAPEAAIAIGRAFGMQMLASSPQQAKALYESWKAGDTAGTVRDVANLAMSVGLGAKLTGLKDASTPIPKVEPLGAEFKTPAERGMAAVRKFDETMAKMQEPGTPLPEIKTSPAAVPVNKSESSLIQSVKEQFPRNPIDSGEVIIGDSAVKLADRGNDKIELVSIRTLDAGKGASSAALKQLTDLADAHGTTLTLSAKPIGKGGLAKSDLISWYERNGFKRIKGDYMERPPAAVPVETAPQVTAKAQAEVSQVAKTEGPRPAKDIKNELVARLEKAIEDAPSKDTPANQEAHEERRATDHGKVTVSIPGDGDFTIPNTKENLSEVLVRAKRISTSTTPPKGYKESGISKEDKAWIEEQKRNQPQSPVAEETQGAIAADWTSATEDAPSPKLEPSKAAPLEDPNIQYRYAGVPIPKFPNRKMSQLDQVTTTHSGKIQKSFDESRRAQKEIRKAVPSDRRQSAISVWREANGDLPTLQSWASAAKGKVFKQAAIDAQTLTPSEIATAQKTIAAFNVLEKRGNTFDVLKSHRDNYVPHVWDVKKPGTGFGTGMLKQRFRFSKARTLNTFFEGDQAGFKPKTLAIGKLLPAYIHEMNTVIADRQMVRDIVTGTAKDGAPLAVPRGNVQVVDGPSGKAVLVSPKSMREADTADYKTMEGQPALSNWIWEGKDTDGKPVFVKADLALHPEAYRRLTATIGQSALRSWYRDPVGGTAQIPRAIARGLDTAQSAMKREMFGLLAPFHQVQEGTHAIGHLVNPFFGIEKVDLRNPKQLDAANHGLMLLPDRASSQVYLEGVGTKSSLLSRGIRKIPKAGEAVADVIDGYQDYLFHQYIPGLKFKTYEAMLGRNTKLYAKELASGEMTPADVKITSAEQANAAYGHLNYALLDRNPTIQHFMQLSLLAPDFLEARARFAGQGVKGTSSKVGHEQFKAIAILAAAQAGTAFVLSNMLGVPYDPKHPFEVVYRGRRYAMRSVPEDLFSLMKDTRQFAYGRVNPLIVKGGVQLATGLNYRGEKVGPLDTVEELLAGYIPITARSIPALRSLTETSRNNPVSPLQQLAGSLGLRISRYSPVSETYKLAGEWMDSQKLDRGKGSYPISKYQQLRYALEDGDMERAKSEYDELLKTMKPSKISDGFKESINHPFTGKKLTDAEFEKSLKGYDHELYKQAIRTRENILNGFREIPK